MATSSIDYGSSVMVYDPTVVRDDRSASRNQVSSLSETLSLSAIRASNVGAR